MHTQRYLHPFSNAFATVRSRVRRLPLQELVLATSILAGLNLAVLTGLPTWDMLPLQGFSLQPMTVIITVGCNVVAWVLLLIVQKHVLQPWARMVQLLRHAGETLSEEQGQLTLSGLSLRDMAGTLARFTSHSQDAFAKYTMLEKELEASRQLLATLSAQQQVVIATANREVTEQYRYVLAYANYLDQHIARHRADKQLRYDFDDLCESGFNLKLITQSLELLSHGPPPCGPVALVELLLQTMLTLAPALERRAMRLSTEGTDEEIVAYAHAPVVSHALWMLLLGTIRYAAPESTLCLRCLPSVDGEQAIITILISELSPGQLTPEERYDHLVRQMQHVTPHMFAETIRTHANAQLAELMLFSVGGRVQLLPISSHVCEISLFLPIMKK